MKILFLIISLLSVSFATTPCGRCVNQGQVCARDFCTYNLICSTIGSTASVCYPSAQPGVWCNQTKDYNSCQNGFTCDRAVTGTCVVITPFAKLNDGCMSNSWCVGGLNCTNNVCTLPPGNKCTSDGNCGWNQYCNSTFFMPQNNFCSPLPGTGQSCAITNKCQVGQNCGVNQICVNYFSLAAGSQCTAAIECQTGLDCYNGLCVTPSYHFLSGPGVIWGPDCDPAEGDPGCRCNFASNIYQYLIESSVTYNAACSAGFSTFEKCMTQFSCSNTNTGALSCMRKNCYTQYNSLISVCTADPSLVQPHCGASEVMVMLLLALVMMLL